MFSLFFIKLRIQIKQNLTPFDSADKQNLKEYFFTTLTHIIHICYLEQIENNYIQQVHY